ncbi:hypothetical protein BSKO_13173 [Bryopsis sp. KO-2023]|nr:hypothetical protein BSKO_13173 [Bryopsis sp. KO-2023]
MMSFSGVKFPLLSQKLGCLPLHAGFRSLPSRVQSQHIGGAVCEKNTPFVHRAPVLRPRKPPKDQKTGAAVEVLAPVATQVSATKALAIVVGYLVVAGSMIRSLPQIIRVIKNKSGEGISIASIVSEVVAYIITTAYNVRKNYPFSTYGDVVMCNIQNVVLLGAILWFKEDRKLHLVAAGGLILALFAYWVALVSTPTQLWGLQALTIAILAIGGKFLQIWENLRRGNSGELSIITCGLNVAGTVARMFTHLTMTQDWLNVGATGLFFVLSVILLHQTLVTAGVYGRPQQPPNEGLVGVG